MSDPEGHPSRGPQGGHPLEGPVARDVDAELSFHIEARTRDLIRGGLTPHDARARALAEFGDLAEAREELIDLARRDRRWRMAASWLSELLSDLRFAGRTLTRRPGLLAALLLTLSLGIGATTAIFTVLEASLLRPLPYQDPDRLVHLWETPDGGATLSEASYPDFQDWRTQSGTFDGLEGYDPTNVTVSTERGGTMLPGARVTAGFFGLLGIHPRLGRAFLPGEDGPGGSPVVLLSDGYWRRELGGDPAVIGTALDIDRQPHEIVGILPRGFQFAPLGDTDLWLPIDEGSATRQDRARNWLNVVGRLRGGVSPTEAQSRLNALVTRLPGAERAGSGPGVRVVDLKQQVTGPIRPLVLALFAAAGLLLLVACVNVAGLLVARGVGRSREMAVRSALGASRGRLLRQLLAEGLLVAGLGAALGFGAAQVGARVLVSGAVAAGVFDQLPFLREVRPDLTVLAFTAAVGVLTGLGFGLVPLLHFSKARFMEGLRGTRITPPALRLRDLLVMGELALTMTLLVGAGLVGRSLFTLVTEDPGFKPERVLTSRVALSGAPYREGVSQQQFFEELLERIRAIPGVEGVGAVTNVPTVGGGTLTYRVEGEPELDPAKRPRAFRRGVAGDYLATLGIPLLQGRAFTAADDALSPLALLVNESLARRLFPGGGAVGRELSFYDFPPGPWEIVGVVGDVKTGRLDEPAPPTVYYSHLQVPENRLTLVVRVARGGEGLVQRIRAQVADMDPAVAVYGEGSLTEVLADSPAVAVRRYPLLLIATFAGAALLLGLIGVYGVVSYSVAQRLVEFGVRAALGASPGHLFRAELVHGLRLAAAGVAGGFLLSFLLARGLSSSLYGVTPSDPLIHGLVAALVGLTAMLASVLPARRAAVSDPVSALRCE